MTIIKSVTTVRAMGNGNSGNWVARVRLTTGEELFAGLNSSYNMAQAQALINNNRLSAGQVFENTIMNNSALSLPDAPIFHTLPASVKISAK